jgi:hypothetical protein
MAAPVMTIASFFMFTPLMKMPMYDFIGHYHRIASARRQQALSERLAFMVPFFRIKHPGKPDSGCLPLKNDQKTSNRALGPGT